MPQIIHLFEERWRLRF